MPYNVTIKEDRDYLRCEVSGERLRGKMLEDIQNAWSQITAVCKEKGITKILAIFKLKGEGSILGSYQVVKNAKTIGWERQFKLALFDTDKDSRIGNQFTETVAFNNGYNMKVFDNETSALTWLLAS